MEYLPRTFDGEGNATWNLAEAERLDELLHYKSERAMSFEIFLTECQNFLISMKTREKKCQKRQSYGSYLGKYSKTDSIVPLTL